MLKTLSSSQQHKNLLNYLDHKIELNEIADTLTISKERDRQIVHTYTKALQKVKVA